MISEGLKEIMTIIEGYDQASDDPKHHLYTAERFQWIIASGKLDPSQQVYAKYQLAICLDLGGKPLDALELIHEAIRSEPHQSEFQHSKRVLHGRVLRMAQSLYQQDPANPVLLHYYEILNANEFSPSWLCFAVAHQFAKHPNPCSQAKTIAQTVLSLSPHDPDSLRECLSLASALGDLSWERELRENITGLCKERPHDLRYQRLSSVDFAQGPCSA